MASNLHAQDILSRPDKQPETETAPEWTPCEVVRPAESGELERLREIERIAIDIVAGSEARDMRRMVDAITALQDVFVRFLSGRKARVSCAEVSQ